MYRIRPPTKEIKNGITFNITNVNYRLDYILEFITKKENNYVKHFWKT